MAVRATSNALQGTEKLATVGGHECATQAPLPRPMWRFTQEKFNKESRQNAQSQNTCACW